MKKAFTYLFVICSVLSASLPLHAGAGTPGKSLECALQADNTFALLTKDLVSHNEPDIPGQPVHSSAIEVVDETQTQQTQCKTEVLSLQPESSPLFCFPELPPCKLPFIVFDITAPPPEIKHFS